MHYYSYNISDYMSHTLHLWEMEDLAYRRCLDNYYLHERPLPEDPEQVAKLIRMREHLPDVKQVLKEFFVLEKGKGWINPRADEEIKKYKQKILASSRGGKASALARLKGTSSIPQPTNKQEPINNKHKPINNKQEIYNIKIKRPRNVSKKTWDDFLIHRRNKKAPLTETALKGIKNEVKKTTISLEDALIMCQARGWQSFKSDWISKEQKSFATTNYGEGVQEI